MVLACLFPSWFLEQIYQVTSTIALFSFTESDASHPFN